MQLLAKTLIQPFNAGLGAVSSLALDEEGNTHVLDTYAAVNEDEEGELEDDEGGSEDDDEVDELEELSEHEEVLLEDTAAVHETVTKVCT